MLNTFEKSAMCRYLYSYYDDGDGDNDEMWQAFIQSPQLCHHSNS